MLVLGEVLAPLRSLVERLFLHSSDAILSMVAVLCVTLRLGLRLGGGASGTDLTRVRSPGRPSIYCRMSGRVTGWLSVNSTSASAGTLTFCPLAGPRLIAPATAPAVAPRAVPTTTPGPVTAVMAAPAAAPPSAPLPAPLRDPGVP